MKIAYAISILLAVASSNSMHAQDELAEKPAFLTPIATSMEEAVELQIIESLTLPETYETNLFSLGQTILLQTGREVQATRTVGRNLTLNPSIQLPEEAIRLLIREACLRVPYSGWRENADLLSDRVSKLWVTFSGTDDETYPIVWRAMPTEYYQFNVRMQYDEKNGEPPVLTLYNLTNGYESVFDETMRELQSKFGMFAPRGGDIKAQQREESEPSIWYGEKIANPRNHTSIIEKSNSRWPIAVHVRLARSSRDWSTIIGERSIQSPDRSALTKTATAMYRRILASNGDPLTPDLPVVPTAEMEQPMLHNGVQLLTSRKTVDGMDHLEIRFRFRPTKDEAESK